MGAIFRHELRNYFHSLTAYVFGAFLLAVVGLGSVLYNLQAAVSNFEFVLSFASIIFVVIVPILTMRTLAEERRQRTDPTALFSAYHHHAGGIGQVFRPSCGVPHPAGGRFSLPAAVFPVRRGVSAHLLRVSVCLFHDGGGAAGGGDVPLLLDG